MEYYLITEQWIKEFTPIGEFVDMKLIKPFIKISEDIHVRSLVGKEQYDRLLQGVASNDLTPNETTLLDLIRPSLAYYMVAKNLPFLSTQIRGAGVIKTSNNNIVQASDENVRSLEERCMSFCNYYSQRVIKYLCDNSSLFPLYSSTVDPKSIKETRFGSFYFGDDDTCHNCN